MPRNIEIKARVLDFDSIMEKAQSLRTEPMQLIQQEDIFFNVEQGRLKLRIFSGSRGQLIFYQRDDVSGPKTSTYQIVETDKPGELRELLANAYGEKIIVRKLRRLFMVGRTRIHLDTVENLGEFFELEVVLEEDEQQHSGQLEANELIEKLGINPASFIKCAYADMFEQASSA